MASLWPGWRNQWLSAGGPVMKKPALPANDHINESVIRNENRKRINLNVALSLADCVMAIQAIKYRLAES